MSNWQKKAAFVGGTNYVEREIQGDTYRFFPVRVKTLFRLRRVALPLAKALSTLFAPQNADFGVVQRQFNDTGDGASGTETVTEPISRELAELRTRERTEAITGAIEAFTDPENAQVVGEILIDSLREEFNKGIDNPPAKAVVEHLETPTLIEFLKGVAAANKEVLGPLADHAQAAPGLGEALATVGKS